jgi:hypothetical protein
MQYRLLILLCLGWVSSLWAEDTIVLVNGDHIVGKIKELNRSVLTVKTDYSDSDFKIEWSGVRELISSKYFTMTLSDGSAILGTFRYLPTGQISILGIDNSERRIDPIQLIYLNDIGVDFWSRFNASIDIGFSYAKSNNLSQYSARTNVSYQTERWYSKLVYNHVQSSQENASNVFRTELDLNLLYKISGDWFTTSSLNFLTNTEQKLNLRATTSLGFGVFLVHNNTANWNISTGTTYNSENYLEGANAEAPSSVRKSLEAYVSTQTNIFNLGDLKFTGNVSAFPGITESGRFRLDTKLDLKYDLPRDFYISAGFSMNYDNQPIEVDGFRTPETDYVTQFSFGWSY